MAQNMKLATLFITNSRIKVSINDSYKSNWLIHRSHVMIGRGVARLTLMVGHTFQL